MRVSQSLLNEVKFPTLKKVLLPHEKASQSLLNEVKFPTNLKKRSVSYERFRSQSLLNEVKFPTEVVIYLACYR